MSNTKEFRGEWYSPKQENVKLPGVLTINQEKNEIKLVLFSEKDIAGYKITEQQNRINYCKIILGITNKGEHITLYEHSGYEGGAPMLEYHMGGKFYESSYRPNFAFIGKHFNTPESILFNNYSFRYNFLDSWIDTTRNYFDYKHENNGNLTISVSAIPDIEIQIEEGCKLHIIRDIYSKGGYSRKYELEVKHYVKFNFNSPASLHKFLSLSAKFRAFLTIAVGYPISVLDEIATTDNMDIWHENDSLDVYHSHADENIDDRKLYQHHMFFCSQHYKYDELTNYISKWFEIYDDYHAAIDIFLHAVNPFWKKGNTTVTNVEFTNGLLNICQAIEMFYNQDMGVDFKKTREKFNNTKQQALDKIKKKKDEIGLTDNEMEFFNVPFKVPKENGWMPFQHKLLHQLNEVKIAINGFINQNEFNDFATKLKDCRDDLTHVNHNNDISNTYDLPYLFYHSQILFYAIITNKIGIEQIKINQIMKSSDKFERYFKEDDKNKPLKKHDHKKGD